MLMRLRRTLNGAFLKPGGLAVWLVTFSLTLQTNTYSQEEYEGEVPARQLEAERLREATAAEAAGYRVSEGAPVTFEQLLADPDNVDLNFRYAKTLVARGNVLGAAATLERILLLEPEAQQVRLFYALVLLRLDNLDEAQRQLEALREQPMPDSLRRQIDRYLKEIRLRRKRTRLSSTLSVGFQYDTNRNAAASSKERLLGDTVLSLTGTSKKRDDTALLVIHSLGVTQDLGSQAGHELFGSFDYFLGEQTAVDDLDLQSFSLRAGGVYKGGNFQITPTFLASNVLLSRETFLRTQGFELKADRPLSRRMNAFALGGWTREDYSGITENSAAFQRKGERITMGLGGQYQLIPTMRLGLQGAYDKKNVSESFPYYAYTSYALGGSHTWLLGQGQFLVQGLTLSVDLYDQPDTAVSARTRRDEQLRYRVTYGAPLSLLLGRFELLAPWIEDTTATVTFEQFRSISNVTNYTYTNVKVSAMLTKRVEF